MFFSLHYNVNLLTNNVSDPPTMLRPSPILSLFISTVDSTPGFMGAVEGSTGGSSVNFEEEEEGEIPTGVVGAFFPSNPIIYLSH